MTFLGIKTKAAIESVLHTNHPEFALVAFDESQRDIIYSIGSKLDIDVSIEIIKRGLLAVRDYDDYIMVDVIKRTIPCNTLRNAVKFMSLIQVEVKSAVEQYNEVLKG